MDIYKLIEELSKYTELEGSEPGDLCQLLLSIEGFEDYYCSDGFKKALEKEMVAQLKNFKDFTEIVEREITTTNTIKELVWVG